jgi:hypothetical protein
VKKKNVLAVVLAVVLVAALTASVPFVFAQTTTDVVARVGKTVRVGFWADQIVADSPGGVTKMVVSLKFDARYLTPDTTGLDIGAPGATATPPVVSAIAGDANNKLMTSTITFGTPLTSATTGNLFKFRLKAAAVGTSNFTVTQCVVNDDPEFTASGDPSPNLVIKTPQALHYRLVITSS